MLPVLDVKTVRSALAVSASILCLVACAASEDDSPVPRPPTIGAQYATDDGSAPFAAVQFEAGGRYIATLPHEAGDELDRPTHVAEYTVVA